MKSKQLAVFDGRVELRHWAKVYLCGLLLNRDRKSKWLLLEWPTKAASPSDYWLRRDWITGSTFFKKTTIEDSVFWQMLCALSENRK